MVALDILVSSLEELLLVNLNGNERLNLGPDELVGKVITAHSGQLAHHGVDLDVLCLEGLESILGPLETVSDLLSEHELDTEKGDLRLIVANELCEALGEALGSTVHDNVSDGSLHAALESAEPILDVALALDRVIELNRLSGATEVLVDGLEHAAVNTVEGNTKDSIEHLLEIILNHVRISTNRQNLEEILVGAEVETREDTSLLLEVGFELALAVLKILLHLGEGAGEKIVLAAANDHLLLSDSLHNLLPLGVSVLEDLGLSRHLLGDLTTSEDEYERHPLGLDLKPLLEGLLHLGEGVELGLDLSAERSDAAGSKHLNEVHHVVLELLLVVSDSATNDAREVIVLIRVDGKLSGVPISINFLTKLLLNLLLLER